ncbi:hypothetical protein EJB05_41830 [Eragrostis curvula]|uniref:PHD-type domain-containing protein n=1 Tax=Eragrostis curvula TaxID=38414 RepID=A0A5J9TAN3_9POAL|nr:hypothetical protein EJB05_41830 [Eragrostis curvula]
MTLKSSRCSKRIYREPPLSRKKEFKSSVIKVVDASWNKSSLPSNSIPSNPASEDSFNKRRKIDEEHNSLLANGNMRESTTRSLTTSGCNSSLAQNSDGKTLMVFSILEISNSGANTVGYKGDHEEASAGVHLRNLAGSHSGVNNGQQSSTSGMPPYINHTIKGAWERSSPDADAAKPVMELISARDVCLSILRRDIFPTKEAELSQKSAPNNNESSPLFECMRCESMEDPTKMLICDSCEGAFHLSCCKPRVKKIPQEEWYCQICSRKKPKRQREKLGPKHELPNAIQRPRRGRGTIQDMLVDAEPYETEVRIGTDFQADVPEWSDPIPSNEDQFVDPPLDPSETTMMGCLQLFKDKKSSVSNWVQCREVLDTGVVCGKWRRAPLFVVQSSIWDCSCSVVWDPIHADCAVPQELETDEVLKQLKYINQLKDRLDKKR